MSQPDSTARGSRIVQEATGTHHYLQPAATATNSRGRWDGGGGGGEGEGRRLGIRRMPCVGYVAQGVGGCGIDFGEDKKDRLAGKHAVT